MIRVLTSELFTFAAGFLMMRFWWGLSTDVSLVGGIGVAACVRMVIRFQDLEYKVKRLYEYIENPTHLANEKHLAFEAICLRKSILNGNICKGMTPAEIDQVLRAEGSKTSYMEYRVKDSPNPCEITMLHPFFDFPLVEIHLWFRDGRLHGWNVRDYKHLPSEIRVEYAKMRRMSKG